MRVWQRLVGRRPIVTRLVVAVAVAMTVVLVLAAAFVYWRVAYALDRQLDQDLDAYQQVVEHSVRSGQAPPDDTPGEILRRAPSMLKVACHIRSASPGLLG